MKDITSVAVAQVMLPDIRDYKDDKRQPEPRIDRLIYMADLLEQLPEGKFDLSQWESCICAWTIHVAGQTHRPLADINPIHVARLWLGVPLDDATRRQTRPVVARRLGERVRGQHHRPERRVVEAHRAGARLRRDRRGRLPCRRP